MRKSVGEPVYFCGGAGNGGGDPSDGGRGLASMINESKLSVSCLGAYVTYLFSANVSFSRSPKTEACFTCINEVDWRSLGSNIQCLILSNASF